MNKTVTLGKTKVGQDQPAYIIAEISANHGGDLERAIKIIHAAKDAGADCIKSQTYTSDTLTIDSDKEPFLIKKGTWEGERLYNLYSRAYMPWEWNDVLKSEAELLGMDYFSTAYDFTSVDFLEEVGVDFYKIASFEVVDLPLVRRIAQIGKPIVMSTGMASEEEVAEAVEVIKSEGNENLIILKCSSAYPAVHKDMNLNTMQYFAEKFGTVIGLSDHSLDSVTAIAAVAMGAKVVEKHLCLSRKIETADSTFSMEPKDFKKMVEDIRNVEAAMGTVCFDLSEREKVSRSFRRSIFVVEDIEAGEVITEKNIRIIRPSHGLKPKYYQEVLGKKATEKLERGTPLSFEVIE